MSQSEIKFEVEASRIEKYEGVTHYGVTLFVCSIDDEPEDHEEVPCYFMVFKGPDDGDLTEVARSYASCHQSAMDSVGLEGQISEEEFIERLENSIEVAGALMDKYGFTALDMDNVDPIVTASLFGEEEPEVTDPRLLN